MAGNPCRYTSSGHDFHARTIPIDAPPSRLVSLSEGYSTHVRYDELLAPTPAGAYGGRRVVRFRRANAGDEGVGTCEQLVRVPIQT
jgi:hypothetical protein